MLLKPIRKGITFTLIFLLIFALVGSLIYTFGPLSTHSLPLFGRWLLFVALLLGAAVSARIAGHKGLVCGLGVTIPFVLILAFMGFALRLPGSFSYLLLPKLLLALIAGTVGGILGISLSK